MLFYELSTAKHPSFKLQVTQITLRMVNIGSDHINIIVGQCYLIKLITNEDESLD